MEVRSSQKLCMVVKCISRDVHTEFTTESCDFYHLLLKYLKDKKKVI